MRNGAGIHLNLQNTDLNVLLFNADSVNLGLSALETELVDALHLTEHVPGPETTTSSEPDKSTPALETPNQEHVCEKKVD